MPVPLWVLRKWLLGTSLRDESDIEIAATVEDSSEDVRYAAGVAWNGPDKSKIAYRPTDIPAGATVVLPSSTKSWVDLGHKPDNCRPDRGDEARFNVRRRFSLRLHPNRIEEWDDFPKRDQLKRLISDDDAEAGEIWSVLKESDAPEFTKVVDFIDEDTLSTYPVGAGWVMTGFAGEKRSRRGKSVLLHGHLQHVENAVESVTGDLLPENLKAAIKEAAHYHDYGKADVRFQTWLRNGDAMAARYAPKPIAKSANATTRSQTECGLPEEFRHELLSLLFASKEMNPESETRELMLHLVASHHGRCRPFAPLSVDDSAECVTFNGKSLCRDEIAGNLRLHSRMASPTASRKLARQYGWWSLAYLEAMLRLADWTASDQEGAESRDRVLSDFAAAFGSEVCNQEKKDRIEYTDFCFMTGSGHQHFLGTVQALKENVLDQGQRAFHAV